MKLIIKHLIIAGILFGSLFSMAQEENSDAVYLSLTKIYTLNEDGSWDYQEVKELKLLTYYSFHRLFGETFIIYDPDWQELKINEAYTIMADGKKVPSPDNAFNLVLPRAAANAPAYNHLREMVVTHTGLERGAVINLDYTLSTTAGFYPAFMGEEVLSQAVPVNKMKVVVNIPAELELQHSTYNIRTAPEMTEAGGSKIYTWSFTNLKPRSLEGHQPSGYLFEPRIVFGTSRNLYSVLDDFTDQKAFDYRTNDEMKLFVTNTVNERDKELSGLVALQSAVVDQFNYYGINPKYTGFKVRTAEKTWASNGGTKIEKAVLLAALLRHAGYDAIPVGVIPSRLFDRDACNMMSFSDILVQVSTKDNGLLYLSPGSHQKTNYKYQLDKQTVVVIDPNIESLKTYEPESRKNGLVVEGTFEIDEEQNMKGSMEAKFLEGINPYFQLIDKQQKIKDLMRPGFTSKNITSFEMLETTEALTQVEYQVEKSNIFKTQENYLMWQFPQSSQGFGSFRISQLSEKREAPLAIDMPLKESYHYTLTIPEGMVLVTPEVKIEAKNSIGIAKITVEAKGNEIKLVRSIEFNKSVIKPVDYKDFKELVDVWLNSKYTTIVFKNID